MNRRTSVITLLLLVGLSIIVTGCVARAQNEPAREQTVETVTVERDRIAEIVSAQGNVTTDQQANLVFATSGRIEQVLVDKGDRVQEGQLLAQLEAANLQRQVERAEAALATAQARLEQIARPSSAPQVAAAQAALSAAQAGAEGAQARLEQLLAGPTALDRRATELGLDLAKNQLWGAQAQRDAMAGNAQVSGANKDSAEAQVLVAEVGVQQAQLAQERVVESARAEDIAVLEAQVRQAESQVAQLKAQLDQIMEHPRQEDVAIVEAQAREAQLAWEHARRTMDDMLLKAPFDGIIMSVSINMGEWANPGAPAIAIADTEQMVLEVRLDELDVAQLDEGQPAVLTFEALPGRRVEGSVTAIAPGATQTQGGIAYLAEVSFAPGDLPVKLGMTTNVDIVTEQVGDALLVPNRAITADRSAGRYYVVRRNRSGEAETVEVEIGLRDEERTQILSGLQEGDVLELPQFDAGVSGAMSGQMGLMGRINSAQDGEREP